MCGPIVAALPVDNRSRLSLIRGRLLYNLGRVITYSILGIIFGLVGKGFFMGGYQQLLSIVLGIAIILAVLIPGRLSQRAIAAIGLNRPFALLSNSWGKLFKNSSKLSLFGIGILNGFLPCGFVYVGVAGAVSTGSVLEGAAYMALFGAGTIPILFALGIAGSFVGVRVKRTFARVLPVFALLLGLLFVARGLNLGIPYISPRMTLNSVTEQTDTSCCDPLKHQGH
jgi:hypothetical protein